MAGTVRARAVRIRRLGEAPGVEQMEVGEPGPDEVLVDLAFGGVNPVDRYTAEGLVGADGPLPRTLGSEAAGLLGGRPVLVHGHGLGRSRDGVWASAATVPRAAVVELPGGIDLAQAAVLGIAGATAWRVIRLASVGRDDRVLVLGASGGVGSMIVALARAAGSTVWGQTGDARKAEFIARQGAEEVVVADAANVGEAITSLRPTAVFDALGGGFTAAAVEALVPSGRLVSFGTSADQHATISMRALYRKGAQIIGYAAMVEPEERVAEAVSGALGALAEGVLPVAVERLPMSEFGTAFARLSSRGVTGKLVLDLGSG